MRPTAFFAAIALALAGCAPVPRPTLTPAAEQAEKQAIVAQCGVDRASVSVVGGDLDHLVGRSGEVLEALQELTRLAVLTQTGHRSRLMLDIGGYRAGRRATLAARAAEVVAQVRSTGERVHLEPMTPFERKIVHDAVASAGLTRESEGEEPQRRVVVLPAS